MEIEKESYTFLSNAGRSADLRSGMAELCKTELEGGNLGKKRHIISLEENCSAYLFSMA